MGAVRITSWYPKLNGSHFGFIYVLRKKGSKTKKRMKEAEIEKGDCGKVEKFSFFFFFFFSEDGPVVYPANTFDSRLRGD